MQRRTRRLPGISNIPPIATVSPIIDTSLVAARSTLTEKAAVDQMADDFRTIATRSGGVTREDLSVAGWTTAQIDAHGTAARELADHQCMAS